jgi:glycosyltransferase involved in cell wall biosynthesis
MISIIIPTLNEEEGIAKVLCSIPAEIQKKSEVIVVDVSTDVTPIIAERLGARVIKNSQKGKGRQMRMGVEQSQGDILVFLDGDGTDPPEYMPQLLRELERADLVLGCRGMHFSETDDPSFRRYFQAYGPFIRSLFNLIGFKIKGDPLAGFRAIRRKDWDRLQLESNTFEIETEMNIKAMKLGFVIKEVAIPHLRRAGGLRKSKLVFHPDMHLKIADLLLKHFKDEIIRAKIKKLQERLKSELDF